jgi:peptidoglycan/xylan/chitin deacetylase (PgdA/CDA1 family)
MVVMYHYVRESLDSSPAGVRPLLVDEFEAQLDWIEDNFRVASAEEFLYSLDRESAKSEKPLCLLTFDDGTRDQIEIAAPILRRRSLPATFLVLTWPSEEHRMPVTHALHWALGQPEHQLWDKVKDFAKSMPSGVDALGAPEEAAKIYHYETELRGLIKYAVNFAMSPDIAQNFVDGLIKSQGVDLSDVADEWFLTSQDIQQLHSYGMEVGMHGSSHRGLSQIGVQGMCEEIAHSSAYLKDLLGKPPTWFACPFDSFLTAQNGGEMAVVHQACREVGVKAMITTRKAFVAKGTDSYKIPRFDCIDLPPRSNDILSSLTSHQR